MDQLKKERAKVKAAFTRRANSILRMAPTMLREELRGEWKSLSEDAERLRAANYDCEACLLDEAGDMEAVDEKPKADLERVTRECDTTLKEVKQAIHSNLWSRYAETELKAAIGRAERSYEGVEEVSLERITYDNGKEQNTLLESLITKAENLLAVWEGWIPEGAACELSKKLQVLEDKRIELWRGWVIEFGRVQKEQADRAIEIRQKAASDIAEAEKGTAEAERRAAETRLKAAEVSAGSEERAAEAREKAAEIQLRMAEAAAEESAELAKAQRKAWEEAHSASMASLDAGGSQAAAVPSVRLHPTKLPKFNGCMRDFHRWRRDWENLQRQGDPSGSAEVKKFQLLDSVEEKIINGVRLSSYDTAHDMFRVLENRFGNKTTIAIQIIEELEKLPVAKGNQPRKTIELIQAVEKALTDLTDLGNIEAIKNPLVIKAIESKLPECELRSWLTFKAAPVNEVTPEGHFDALLKFLKNEEVVLEALVQLRPSEVFEKPSKPEWKAFTRATGKDASGEECSVCGDEKHGGKIFFCKKFKALSLAEKRDIVKRNEACQRCLASHQKDGECSDRFLCRKKCCQKGETSDHHYLMCSAVGRQRVETSGANAGTLSDEQQRALANISPEAADQVIKAFTNQTTVSMSASTKSGSLLEEIGLREHPVLMMIMEVTTNGGQTIGTLVDLASDTNYITHQAAKRLRLRGEKITLVVHGIGGMKVRVETERYLLKVRMRISEDTWSPHQIVCYGLDEIARADKVVSPKQLQKFFPEVKTEELVRPEKIELLISHREGRLAPQRMKRVGDLVLWDGPLGKTVGGAHPDLFEEMEMSIHNSKTHFARSMRTKAVKVEEISCELVNTRKGAQGLEQESEEEVRNTATTSKEVLEWWRWDSIGAACEPKCGGCRCGTCQPGGKEMTLVEERELEKIKEGLSYVTTDDHSNSPHWDAGYPWTEDPVSLPYNRKVVEATFLRTEKRLMKDPLWKTAYTAQVHEMVERGAAIELEKNMISSWRGPVWYVSHLIAPNPHSVTTPVRLVWNSSQEFKGTSMNSILLKGPDVLNPIRAVLLRFRTGEHAAVGDIKKMYNSVWLNEREVHLHRFLWRDSPEEEIKDFAITRVNIGDRPAGCIAQLAMRETARLPKFSHMVEERRVLEEDSYVDDILTSHNDLGKLDKITRGVEEILTAGGFSLKPWVRSGQSGRRVRSQPKQSVETPSMALQTLVLPNQLGQEDNKALGVGYYVDSDRLFMMVSINFSKRKQKMRTGVDLLEGEVREQTPDPLTRRELLSQVAGLYDPIGLATPVKERGAILVRRAFQVAGGEGSKKDTWDHPLPANLRTEAIKLFEEYSRLRQVGFERSLTPPGWRGRPWGVTFSDGSDDAFGAVLYLRWETSAGVVTRLVESKAKLTPLDQKGDVVKAEICGAVFAARLKGFWERQGRLEVEKWFHFVDSQTILGAIQRESYGYQTFFANRVGEIQKAGPIADWWWIPGELNVADLVTRGCPPEDLDEGSKWQKGPEFLVRPVEEWPMKSAAEVAANAREAVCKLQRRAFTAVLTRAQLKKTSSSSEKSPSKADKAPGLSEKGEKEPSNKSGSEERLWGAAIVNLVKPEKFSSLAKLCGVISWVCRAVNKWLIRGRAVERAEWEAKHSKEKEGKPVLDAWELGAAFRELCLAAQRGVVFPESTLNRLVVVREEVSGLLVCFGRARATGESGVPLVPYRAWVSTLVARESHEANHEGVAGTMLRMRKKAWVVQAQRVARKVGGCCVSCRKTRAKMCQQVMADLPSERTEPAAPFEFTTLDLFGPYMVRDVAKKRSRMKVWGVVFSCMASRAMHADMVEGLSTESFLGTYQRFTALRGHPKKIWSDRGTNFVGARPALKELYDFLENLDKEEVRGKAARQGTEWIWVFHPADSPHRNGAAEAAVRILKQALSNVGGGGDLTGLEFQTMLYMAANLSNERPIGARLQVQDDAVEVITPNTLLLGRAGPTGDSRGYEFQGYPFVRLRAVQIEVNKFWQRWSQLAGPGLFIRPKWHSKARNVAVGDLVWLADQNALRGQFRLGRVVEVAPDVNGVVRDVKVRTCPSCPVASGKRPEKISSDQRLSMVLSRDVRRLVVLLPVEEQ